MDPIASERIANALERIVELMERHQQIEDEHIAELKEQQRRFDIEDAEDEDGPGGTPRAVEVPASADTKATSGDESYARTLDAPRKSNSEPEVNDEGGDDGAVADG